MRQELANVEIGNRMGDGMRLPGCFLVPGLFLVFTLVMGCAGGVGAPYLPPAQEPFPPSLPITHTPMPPPTPESVVEPTPVAAPFPYTVEIGSPGPTIDITGCTTVICCSDCPDLDVDRIIDGDTFDSANARIRLFGIDTPERGEKCFSEATDRLREIAGDTVLVERGPRAEDQYGRILFYIYTESGESVDEILVREGLAMAWKPDGQHRDVLASTEEGARRDGSGCLW